MIITITAFERSPDRGKGLVRDMRVRSAFSTLNWRFQATDLLIDF